MRVRSVFSVAALCGALSAMVSADPTNKVRLSGAANYDARFDVLRAPMTARTADASIEQFTIGFINVSDSRSTMSMASDRTVATIDLTIALSK